MIDFHCHILPGLDDGAPDLDESLAMARLLAAAGFTHVCCTPHQLRGMYETPPAAMRQALNALQQQLTSENIPITLLPGFEYCLDEFFIDDFSAEPVALGSGRRVLVETPANADPQLLRQNIFHLVRSGYVPLFAHPERHAFLAPPDRTSESFFGRVKVWNRQSEEGGESLSGTLLAELQLMGCEFQGNLGSVGGYYGSLVRQQEQRLRQSNLYACYGSDGHNVASLNKFLTAALALVEHSSGFRLNRQPELIAP